MKLYEIEQARLELLAELENNLDYGCEYPEESMTLKELINYGVNNIIIGDKEGYSEEDFTEEELNSVITDYDFDEDEDGYTIINVTLG